jgi:Holliday junction resolvase RusA-like endonuclease
VYGIPQPAGSKRGFRNPKTGGVSITDANSKSKPWQAEVKNAAADAMMGGDPEGQSRILEARPLLDGPLLLELTFWMPRPKGHFGAKGDVKPKSPRFPTVKPDVLKLARAVEDALTGIVYRDDSQIVSETLQKAYGEPARVEVRVVPIGRATVGDDYDPDLARHESGATSPWPSHRTGGSMTGGVGAQGRRAKAERESLLEFARQDRSPTTRR